jgi:hypothetical protein
VYIVYVEGDPRSRTDPSLNHINVKDMSYFVLAYENHQTTDGKNCDNCAINQQTYLQHTVRCRFASITNDRTRG